MDALKCRCGGDLGLVVGLPVIVNFTAGVATVTADLAELGSYSIDDLTCSRGPACDAHLPADEQALADALDFIAAVAEPSLDVDLPDAPHQLVTATVTVLVNTMPGRDPVDYVRDLITDGAERSDAEVLTFGAEVK